MAGSSESGSLFIAYLMVPPGLPGPPAADAVVAAAVGAVALVGAAAAVVGVAAAGALVAAAGCVGAVVGLAAGAHAAKIAAAKLVPAIVRNCRRESLIGCFSICSFLPLLDG